MLFNKPYIYYIFWVAIIDNGWAKIRDIRLSDKKNTKSLIIALHKCSLQADMETYMDYSMLLYMCSGL